MSDDEDPRGDLAWGTIPGLVAYAAAEFGDAEALVDGPTRLTFTQLADRSIEVTRAVMAAGIRPGDRVALWAPNMAEWVLAALGALGAGAVLVPLNTRFKGEEAAYVIRRAGARILFTVRGFLGTDYPAMLEGEDVPSLERIVLLREAEGDASEPTGTDEVPVFGWGEFLLGSQGVVEADGGVVGVPVVEHDARNRWQAVTGSDLSDLIFTSGTTGRPKGVKTTHAQTLRTFATWSEIVGLQAGDRYLIVNPFFHTFGYKAGILACLMRGVTIVPLPVFDLDRVLETVQSERVTVVPGPPTLYQSVMDHPRRGDYDLSSLRLAVTGAAVVPVELIRRMRSELTFSTVLTAYGLTESTGVVTMCRQGDEPETIAQTSGRAIPGVEVKVVDDKGHDVAAGSPGEIVVRGYTVTSGYIDDPEATAEAIDADGWLRTGDVGVLDDGGNLRITDRKKDMFIVGGFNAYPAEIEGVLLRLPAVAQVAVVGVPDERLGEVGHAFVVPRPGANTRTMADELVAFAREHMANYKVPRHVEVIDSLPTNASGKVLKTELRRLATAGR
ncbi:MAG TPA: FadD3 family acyl-CoA ligase, partial [Acidimicrobiales bacterium]|nr:FadD3 family acyl-CoA ligase [Acidimicrobiales bacterium]